MKGLLRGALTSLPSRGFVLVDYPCPIAVDSGVAQELALAIRHWLERLCVRRKESEVQFEMLV